MSLHFTIAAENSKPPIPPFRGQGVKTNLALTAWHAQLVYAPQQEQASPLGRFVGPLKIHLHVFRIGNFEAKRA